MGVEEGNKGGFAEPGRWRSERPPIPLRIWLDQYVYVDLAKRAQEGPCALQSSLRNLVSAGRIEVVLSDTNYFETWHRPDDRSRRDVATVMRDVSRYRAFSAPHRIQEREVESSLDHWRRSGRFLCQVEDVVGTGARYAFLSPTGRFDMTGWEPSTENDAFRKNFARQVDLLPFEDWEWLNLYGADGMSELDGLDRAPLHRWGTRFREQEMELRAWLAIEPSRRKHLRELLYTQSAFELKDLVEGWARRTRTRIDGVFFDKEQRPTVILQNLIDSLPMESTMLELRELVHRNLQHPLDQHDRADLTALSCAIPYADVVLTEKRWQSLATRAKLDRRFSTKIVSGMEQFEAIVANLADQHPAS